MQAEVHSALVGFIVAVHSAGYAPKTLVIDNNPFDWNDPPEVFTEIEIEFSNGEQVNMAESPSTRLYGFIYVSVHAKVGSGNRDSLQRLDAMAEALKYARIGRANLQEPKPDGTSQPTGWFVRHLKIEFHTDPA